MRTKLFCFALLALLLVSPSLAASYNMCLTAPGLKGEVSDRDHRDAVGVLALKGPTKPGESGPLVIQKNLDQSSNALFAACLAGTAYPSIVIDVMQPIGGNLMVVSRLTLGKAIVKGIEFKYESTLIEEVTLAYDTINWEYREIRPDGSSAGAPVIQGWDNNARTKL